MNKSISVSSESQTSNVQSWCVCDVVNCFDVGLLNVNEQCVWDVGYAVCHSWENESS